MKTPTFLIWCLISPVYCFKPYIVDGKKARPNSFTHSAALGISCLPEADQQWHCGSSIVNQRVLLSAAHCFQDCENENIDILITVGNVNRQKGKRIAYSQHRCHEDYNKELLENDIAIVLTKEAIRFSRSVGRVALLENPPKTLAHVAGWGVTHDLSRSQSRELRYTSQVFINNTECYDALQGIPNNTVCTMPPKGEKGRPGVGDSGSALVVRGFIQIGIVSYKDPNYTESITVYTNVPEFLEWIQRNAKELYCRNKPVIVYKARWVWMKRK